MKGPEVKKTQIELHEKLSDDYVQRYEPEFSKLYQRHRNNDLLKGLPTNPTLKVLDCGCGTGVLFERLKKRYHAPVGIDLSMSMLEKVNKKDEDGFICADAETLPFSNDSFDIAISRGVLHHVPNPHGAITQIHKSLKKGGYFLVSEPCNDFWLVRFIREKMYKKSKSFDDNEHPFISIELASLMKIEGFKILKTRFFGYFAYMLAGFPDILPVLKYVPFNVYIVKALIFLDEVISRIPVLKRFGLHVVILGVKE